MRLRPAHHLDFENETEGLTHHCGTAVTHAIRWTAATGRHVQFHMCDTCGTTWRHDIILRMPVEELQARFHIEVAVKMEVRFRLVEVQEDGKLVTKAVLAS